jgi:hypothetical protein
MANNFKSRTWQINTNGSTPNGGCNYPIKGGVWTGMSTDAVFTITDAKGIVSTFKAPASGDVLNLICPSWMAGPLTFALTGTTKGEVELFIK